MTCEIKSVGSWDEYNPLYIFLFLLYYRAKHVKVRVSPAWWVDFFGEASPPAGTSHLNAAAWCHRHLLPDTVMFLLVEEPVQVTWLQLEWRLIYTSSIKRIPDDEGFSCFSIFHRTKPQNHFEGTIIVKWIEEWTGHAGNLVLWNSPTCFPAFDSDYCVYILWWSKEMCLFIDLIG